MEEYDQLIKPRLSCLPAGNFEVRAVAHKSAIILLSRLGARAIQILSFVLLARELSPAGFGAFGVLTASVAIVGQLGNCGLRQASAFQIGRGLLNDGAAFGLLIAFWLPVAAACSLVVVAFNTSAIDVLNSEASSGVGLPLAAAMSGYLLLILLEGILLGRGDIKAFALSDNGPRYILALAVAGLWLFDSLTVGTAIWGFALSYTLLAPFIIRLARQRAGPIALPFKKFPDLVKYGMVFAISMFLISLQGRAGIFILNKEIDTIATGNFLAAQRINEIFLEMATAVGLILFTESTRSSNTKEAISIAAQSVAVMFWLFAAIAVALFAVAGSVVPIVLGEEYSSAVPAVRLLALSLVPSMVIKLMNGVMAGAGRPYLSAAVVAISLVVNVSVTFTLAQNGSGPAAAAYGFLVAQTAGALCYVSLAKISYGVPFKSFVWPFKGEAPKETNMQGVE